MYIKLAWSNDILIYTIDNTIIWDINEKEKIIIDWKSYYKWIIYDSYFDEYEVYININKFQTSEFFEWFFVKEIKKNKELWNWIINIKLINVTWWLWIKKNKFELNILWKKINDNKYKIYKENNWTDKKNFILSDYINEYKYIEYKWKKYYYTI